MNGETIFYQRLKNEIEKRGKSFNQVEKELGYPRNALHSYRYSKGPSGRRLLDLSHYLDVTPEYLMGEEDRPVYYFEQTFQTFNTDQKFRMLLLCEKWMMSQIQYSKSIDLQRGMNDNEFFIKETFYQHNR